MDIKYDVWVVKQKVCCFCYEDESAMERGALVLLLAGGCYLSSLADLLMTINPQPSNQEDDDVGVGRSPHFLVPR